MGSRQYNHYRYRYSGEEKDEFVAIRTQNRNHIRRQKINQNYAKSHLTALPKFYLRKSQAEDPKATQKKKGEMIYCRFKTTVVVHVSELASSTSTTRQ